MNDFSKVFLQVILLLLALVFTFTVRYLCSTESSQAWTASGEQDGNVTLAEVFSAQLTGER